MSKWVKRAGIALGTGLGLFVAAAIIIPLVIDVDTYRPKIVEAAGEHLNGSLDLGKLKLSLWGAVKVQVDGFALKDAKGKNVVSSDDVYFHVPLFSLIRMAPHVTLNLTKPTVVVEKDGRGELNVMKLVKKKDEAAPPAEAETEGKAASVPSIVKKARLGVQFTHANVTYLDLKSDVRSEFKDVNLVLKEISLDAPSEVALWGEVDTKVGESISVKGPVRFEAKGKPELENGEFVKSTIDFKLELSQLVISMPETFQKPDNIPAHVTGVLELSKTAATFQSLKMQFHNAILEGTGGLMNVLDNSKEKPLGVDVKLTAKPIELAPWKPLVKSLEPYEVHGSVGLSAWAKGPLEDLNYQADIALKKATFSGANLKAPVQLEASMRAMKDKVEPIRMSLAAPGSDLKVEGSLRSFEAPNVRFAITSKVFDVDKLMKLPEGKPEAAQGGGSGKAAGEAVDFDALVAPLRENAIAKKATGTVTLEMGRLVALGVPMTSIKGQMSLRKLQATVDRFRMGVFKGVISANGKMDLKPKMPTYDLALNVSQLDMQDAVKSQFMPFKNTIVGQADFKMQIKGQSFNPAPAKKQLSGGGNMFIKDAQFNTIDITQTATKALNDSLNKVAAKVPQLRGKTIKPPANQKSEFESIASDFSIGGGTFRAPNFFAKAKPNKGIDVRGNTEVNLINDGLKAEWRLIDTYNQLKARDMSVKIAGTVVPHIIAKGNEPVTLPVSVSGSLFSPKISYLGVPEALANVALGNLKQAGEARVKKEVENKVKEGANKILKGLFR